MSFGLITAFLLFVGVFALAEVLYRAGSKAWLTRKVTHIGGALSAVLLPYLVDLPVALGLGLFFCCS